MDGVSMAPSRFDDMAKSDVFMTAQLQVLFLRLYGATMANRYMPTWQSALTSCDATKENKSACFIFSLLAPPFLFGEMPRPLMSFTALGMQP